VRAEHIVVTGAAGAIGRALAQALAADRPGSRFSLVDVAPCDDADPVWQGRARAFVFDLAAADDVAQVLRLAEDAHGPVTGLINCAGIMDVRRMDRTPWSVAEKILSVDLAAPLRLMHAVLPAMVQEKHGFVVNVSSMAGRVPLRGCAFYGAAKAGLAMASEIAHAEFAELGVHVLTVYPGPVASALERGARAQYAPSVLARAMPTGHPGALAQAVMHALRRKARRVVFPSAYALGFHALHAATRFALAAGPAPAQ
jgi:short-subunit dehydrogenase